MVIMVLQISPATKDDNDRIATIHLKFLEDNALLHAQFPTKESLAALHTFLSEETLDHISRRKEKAVIVVRDSEVEGSPIISFAKWDLPGLKGGHGHAVATWPEGTQQPYIDEDYEKVDAAKNRETSLNFVGTLPEYIKRGAATLLMKWGIERARKENVPIYLEAGVQETLFYRKLGFVALDGLSMTLPNKKDGTPNVYEEVCMLLQWDKEDEGMDHWDSSLNISSLELDYEAGIKPQTVVQAFYDRIDAYKTKQPCLWLHVQPLGEVLRAASEIQQRWPDPKSR